MEEDFQFDVLIQLIGSIIILLLSINIYRGSKVQLVVGSFMTIFIVYCMTVSQYGNDWRDEVSLSSFLLTWLFFFILFFFLFAV